MEETKAKETSLGRAIATEDGSPASDIVTWRERQDAVMTSLKTDTEEGKQVYLSCLASPAKYARHCLFSTLRVKDWFIHMVERANNETGEVTPGMRLVWVLEDGSTVATSSSVLIGNWGHVVKLYGLGQFDPPLEIEITSGKGKVAGEYLQISRVRRALAAPTKPAKKV